MLNGTIMKTYELILEKTSSNRSKDLLSEQSNDSGGDQSKKRSKMLV